MRRLWLTKLGALAAMVPIASAFLLPTAIAAGARAGDAVPTDPSTNATVTSGGSSTAWTLKLPAGAACTGDTASQGYHLYSYVVPASVDPATLTFNPSTGPSTGYPLVDTTGTAHMAANTAAVTGQVIQIPVFDWSLFATTDQGGTKLVLAPGDYNVGIACANTVGQGDKFWSTQFTFTANGSDPNGEVWTDHAAADSAASTGGNSLALPIGIAAIACAGLVIRERRRRGRSVEAVR